MQRSSDTLTIPISGTDSDTKTVPAGFTLAGIMTPAALTGTSFSLKGSIVTNGPTLAPVYNGGTLYSVDMGVSRLIPLNTDITKNLATFAIVSGSAEAAARTFTAIYVK